LDADVCECDVRVVVDSLVVDDDFDVVVVEVCMIDEFEEQIAPLYGVRSTVFSPSFGTVKER
jgi:hypothetical protein